MTHKLNMTPRPCHFHEIDPALDIAEQKIQARKIASKIRKQAAHEDINKNAGQAPQRIFDFLQANEILKPGLIISGFLPIGSEIDTRPILEQCRNLGLEICLPCVEAEAAPLTFRLWHPSDLLVKEKFGTMAPASSAPEVLPDIILAPMLAFDRKLFRLGYGGGFYDRSLEKIRKQKKLRVIGVAYSAQEVENVPVNALDQPLDAVITEMEVIGL